jgi:hypothetical protein
VARKKRKRGKKEKEKKKRKKKKKEKKEKSVDLLRDELHVATVLQVRLDHRQLGLHGKLAERAVGVNVMNQLRPKRFLGKS